MRRIDWENIESLVFGNKTWHFCKSRNFSMFNKNMAVTTCSHLESEPKGFRAKSCDVTWVSTAQDAMDSLPVGLWTYFSLVHIQKSFTFANCFMTLTIITWPCDPMWHCGPQYRKPGFTAAVNPGAWASNSFSCMYSQSGSWTPWRHRSVL